MADAVRFGLTGDVMLGRNVDERTRRRPATAVWGDLLDRLRSLDGLFVNLECCLSSRGSPWRRTHRPFHFRADPEWAVPALSGAGVDGVTLANNHVLDYGEVALSDTLSALDGAEIARTGAGRDADEAREPAVLSADGLSIAVVGFTDNTPEFAAGEDSPGTARIEMDPADPDTRAAVRDALERADRIEPDLVVASLHWGPNMVVEPPEGYRRFARFLVDAGVDLIHGHSAHVFQGIEVVDGVPVIYDAGDFVDDYAVDQDLRNDRTFLFEVGLDPDDGHPTALWLLPTEIADGAVHRAGPEAAAWCRERLRARSAPFGTPIEREGEELVVPIG